MHVFEITDSMCEQTGTGSSVVNTGLSLGRVDLSAGGKERETRQNDSITPLDDGPQGGRGYDEPC